jgi:tRNA-2-methylthio-N6-dimethylallyladenosine synthase
MGSENRKRAYVETYGCQMNVSDGQLMEGVLAAGGYEIVTSPEGADVVLVNTCAIRDHAEQRVLGRVGQLSGLKRENPEMVLGVTGCMAQRMGTDLLERAPHVDIVLGPDAYRSLPERLAELGKSPASPVGARSPKRRMQLTVVDLDTGENYEGLEQRRSAGPVAWVPIQRGCDHRCTFCIVPYVRGPEKNRSPHEVLAEVRRLAEAGVSEVTLLGQTVNSYAHEEWDFPRLLREVARVDGLRRVRFTSPHPIDVTETLVEVMATEPAVCEQLHLPAQSGSDRTLKRMLRRYTLGEYLDRVALARSAIPDLALSTDIIVAFPGETESEFEETLDLMRAVRFDDAFTYRFSPREGTPATRLPAESFIPERVAQARLERLIEVARGIQEEINRAELGRVDEVPVERAARFPGQVLGRTRRNKVVAFEDDLDDVGSNRSVRLIRTRGPTFVGSPAESRAAVGAA